MIALDKALASFHVERQAYYSGTFVGNHVHRCLKVQCIHVDVNTELLNCLNALQERNIDTICASVTSTAFQLNPSLHTRAQQVADRFSKAFKLFGKCHNVFDENYVSDSEVEELGKCDTSEDTI